MAKGTVNGVPVIGASAVPWQTNDDARVVMSVDSRGLVLFEGGGKSDAIVIGGQAIIWERNGEAFRAFAVDVPASGRDPAKQTVPALPGLWSMAVCGTIRHTMVRVSMQVTPEGVARKAEPVISVGVIGANGAESVVEVPLRELRALLGAVGEWPGVRRG